MDDLHVEVAGDGPLAVLVHGTAPATWGKVTDLLAADHRVLSYDRRGFPPSPGAPGASLRRHADDLEALITSQGGRGAVIGWSIGGVIALDLALRHPELVERLVLLEAPLRAARRPTLPLLRAVLGAQRRARRSPEDGARHFLTWALGRRSGGDDVHRLDPVHLAQVAPAVTAELGAGTGEKEIGAKALAHLSVPTRWLVGSDSVPEFAAAARRAHGTQPAIEIVEVAGAGHAIQLDAPDAVLAATAS